MLTEYKIPCDYIKGKLKNHLYLLLGDVNWKIDGTNEPTATSYNPINKIYINNITLSEEETFDNKYKFNIKLNVSLNDFPNDIIDTLINNDYKLIVEDDFGKIILNADNKYKFQYEYSLTNTDNKTDCTFEILSNIPTMRITFSDASVITELNAEICSYNKPTIDDLYIAEQSSIALKTIDSERYLKQVAEFGNDVWKNIEFIKNTLTFSHQYNEERITDTIQFRIPLSAYKATFHYNILEFRNNIYAVKFSNIVVENLQPSYTLETSDDTAQLNTIQITLKTINNYELNRIKEDRKATSFGVRFNETDVENIKTYECISDSSAKVLIVEETENGKGLGTYLVLEGYEDKYSILGDKVNGTFTEDDINNWDFPFVINCKDCEKNYYKDSCTSFNLSTFQVNRISDEIFTINIKSNCDWKVKSDAVRVPISIDKVNWGAEIYSSGDAKVFVDLTRIIIGINFNITIESDNIIYTCPILKVAKNILVKENTKTIDSNKQVVEFISNVENVKIVNNSDAQIITDGFKIYVTVPENYSTNSKIYSFTVKYKDITRVCTITQNGINVTFEKTNTTICFDGNKYESLRQYENGIGTDIYEYGKLVEANSDDCNENIRWIITDNTYCFDGKPYYTEERQERINDDWQSSGEIRQSTIEAFGVIGRCLQDNIKI